MNFPNEGCFSVQAPPDHVFLSLKLISKVEPLEYGNLFLILFVSNLLKIKFAHSIRNILFILYYKSIQKFLYLYFLVGT